jgi:hypothetical protein
MQNIPHVALFNVEASAKLRELYLEARSGLGGVTCCHFDLITMLLERKLKTSINDSSSTSLPNTCLLNIVATLLIS